MGVGFLGFCVLIFLAFLAVKGTDEREHIVMPGTFPEWLKRTPSDDLLRIGLRPPQAHEDSAQSLTRPGLQRCIFYSMIELECMQTHGQCRNIISKTKTWILRHACCDICEVCSESCKPTRRCLFLVLLVQLTTSALEYGECFHSIIRFAGVNLEIGEPRPDLI
ncbi:hypothetical protein F4823DRAFT_308991 [Ustulina deusta]|nr:hypothetical protein F4823DRAFT_308991 [Ustulina deusta]